MIATSTPQRAQRFPVHLPIRYRSAGEGPWREGTIENISRTGVLFEGDGSLDVDTPLEMTFALPVAGAPGISCRGRIVRIVRGPHVAAVALAATISAYRFVRENDSRG